MLELSLEALGYHTRSPTIPRPPSYKKPHREATGKQKLQAAVPAEPSLWLMPSQVPRHVSEGVSRSFQPLAFHSFQRRPQTLWHKGALAVPHLFGLLTFRIHEHNKMVGALCTAFWSGLLHSDSHWNDHKLLDNCCRGGRTGRAKPESTEGRRKSENVSMLILCILTNV